HLLAVHVISRASWPAIEEVGAPESTVVWLEDWPLPDGREAPELEPQPDLEPEIEVEPQPEVETESAAESEPEVEPEESIAPPPEAESAQEESEPSELLRPADPDAEAAS